MPCTCLLLEDCGLCSPPPSTRIGGLHPCLHGPHPSYHPPFLGFIRRLARFAGRSAAANGQAQVLKICGRDGIVRQQALARRDRVVRIHHYDNTLLQQVLATVFPVKHRPSTSHHFWQNRRHFQYGSSYSYNVRRQKPMHSEPHITYNPESLALHGVSSLCLYTLSKK